MNNLPKDLVEEVLSRVPIKSMKNVRLTCKKWNILSKALHSFAKKHLDQATKNTFMVVIIMNYRVHLMSINHVESRIELKAKLISLDDSYEVDICKVFHCYGLLLCITKDRTKLVVWNPYWGQTRCIEPTFDFRNLDRYLYAIGYNKNSCSYKILTFISWLYCTEIKIYDLNSNSWRVCNADVAPHGKINYYNNGVSLKGDTYWIAREFSNAFLVCFDFTKERFGPLLPLPFDWSFGDVVILSSVREEKLAVLLLECNTIMMKIWITTEIKPNTVQWNSKVFLAVDMMPVINDFRINFLAASFPIDEESKEVVVFDRKICDTLSSSTCNYIAFVVGDDGSFKKAYLEECIELDCSPLACSYVPSLVQLN